MPTEAEVLPAAQAMCASDGRGIRISDITPLGNGYAVSISVPKQSGMSDSNWHAVVEDMRSKLMHVPGVTRVTVDIV